jgi:hypothetical protein
MLGKSAAKKVDMMPLSNNTVPSQVNDMSIHTKTADIK